MSEKSDSEVDVAQPQGSDRPKDPKPPKSPTKKRPVQGADKPPRPDRTNLWVAMVGLLTAISVGIASVYQSSVQTEKLRDVSLAIRDTEDIRTALRKPLEGVWHYELRFDKYFGQDKRYVATGTAILLWEPTDKQYRVYVAYSVSKEWAQEKLVTAFVGGTLKADEMGWPSEGFEMPMQYFNRTGVAEFANPLAQSYTLTRGKVGKIPGENLANRVTAHYENPRSVGKMLMYR